MSHVFVDKLLSLQIAKTEQYEKQLIAGPGFNSCDAYASAVAINDSLVTEKEEVKILLLSFHHLPVSSSVLFCKSFRPNFLPSSFFRLQ